VRLNIVSDVHYRMAGLAEAGDGGDVFVCLGDLILFLDYDDPSQGIFSTLFGPENCARYIQLRFEKRYDDARDFSRGLYSELAVESWAAISAQVDAQYRDLFAVMPAGFLTYGNVDIPTMWQQHLRGDHVVVDGQVVDIGGLLVGFIGGGLRTTMRTPNEISDAEYAAKVAAMGSVDLVCSHSPPAIPEITYDVVARRLERGSTDLLAYIHDVQPRYVFHGHVHQPLIGRVTVGKTQIINVGHFRAHGKPFQIDID